MDPLKCPDMVYKCCALSLHVVTGSDSSPICRCSIEQRKENTQGSKEKKKASKGRKKKTKYKDTLPSLCPIDIKPITETKMCYTSFSQPDRCSQTGVCRRPTRLSSPPPRRSIAPICKPEEGGGVGPVAAGGVRSRLSRSPRRSPWDGMTAGGASETPAAEPVSGLSTLSPLLGIKQEFKIGHFCWFSNTLLA